MPQIKVGDRVQIAQEASTWPSWATPRKFGVVSKITRSLGGQETYIISWDDHCDIGFRRMYIKPAPLPASDELEKPLPPKLQAILDFIIDGVVDGVKSNNPANRPAPPPSKD